MSECNHQWIVFSTALAEAAILVECAKCNDRGSIPRQHSTKQDWSEAFHAPSDSYPLRAGLYAFVE